MNKRDIGILMIKIFALYLLVKALIIIGRFPLYPLPLKGSSIINLHWLDLIILIPSLLCLAIMIGTGWYLLHHSQGLALHLLPESSVERHILRISLDDARTIAFAVKILGVYLFVEGMLLMIGQLSPFYPLLFSINRSSMKIQWLGLVLPLLSLLCLAIMIGSGWYLIRHSQGLAFRLLPEASVERCLPRLSLGDVAAVAFSAVGLYLVALCLTPILLIWHNPQGILWTTTPYDAIFQFIVGLLLLFKSRALMRKSIIRSKFDEQM